MHEHHAVQGLVNQILTIAQKNKAVKVSKVTIVIGELSGFKEPSVRHYFEEFTKDNLLKNSVLEIKNVPPQLECTRCQKVFFRQKDQVTCPQCAGDVSPVKRESEFYVENIEVES